MISQEAIFQIKSKKEFEKITLKVFRHQYDNNLVYQEFCNFLNKDKNNVKSLFEIPFLPIQFFKSHNILSTDESIQQTFAVGETVFFSRSRNELWHKGATSGHTQRVLKIEADCDSDCLLVEVEEHGPACHNGTDSCFDSAVLGEAGNLHG